MPTAASPKDFPANPIEKAGYTLEFHDEFEGPTLDTNKWLPFYLPHWSSQERTKPNYTFVDGNLVLQILESQEPWCPEFDGEVRTSSIQTGHFSGPLGSHIGQLQFNKAAVVREEQENVRLYTPQYGYFELRAKGLNVGGVMVALWLIGYEDEPEKSGEICMFELVGAHVGIDSSIVNYGIHPWADPTLHDEFFKDSLPMDTSRFHIYGMEWTPTHVDFYVDNQKIRTVAQSPAYPMQFMLDIYEFRYNQEYTGDFDTTAPYPKNFVVDYFRGYQPIAGYPTD